MPYYSISTPTTGNATQLQSRPISTAAPSSGNSLVWDGSAWVPANGVTGATGPAGQDGAKVYHGDGAPAAAFGTSGDLWVDTTGQRIYGPKANGSWGEPMNLAPGLPGPTGATGVGATGPAGVAGATGATGAAGASVTGPAGSAGSVGATGATGPAGQAGTSGSNGAVGATGPTGAAGSAGTNGAAGAAGATGPTGASGASGSNGEAGATGATGPAYQTTVTGVSLSGTGTYNPLTLDSSFDCYYLTLATGAAIQALSITGPTGATKLLLNIGTTGVATLNHATGANANARFATVVQGNIQLTTGGGATVIQYDGAAWRVL